jgi:hypothetical protein
MRWLLGKLVPRKSSATGSAQKDKRMDGLHRSERGTGLHPGGSVYGDGRRDGEMQEEAFVRSSGRSRSGAVFILTSSGLRRIGLRSGLNQPNSDGGGFLGYPRGELYWKDAFDLVHKDDLHLLWFLLSLVIEEPGTSESIEIRFRKAWGNWVLTAVFINTEPRPGSRSG